MKKLKEEDGFTLIEMLIVLLVISVLMLIVIPNVTKSSKSIDTKGCDAFVVMIQGQVEAYKMDQGGYPSTLEDMADGNYLPTQYWKEKVPQCQDGTKLIYAAGEVSKE